MFLPLRMPAWPKTAWYLCDIYSSSVFDGVLDLFGTPRGDNCFFSQWMHCLSSSRDPTSILSKWEKCIIGHMRPALFLVHFWSNFTVLGKKKALSLRNSVQSKKLCGKVLFLNFYLRLSMKKWSLHCCYGQFLVFSLKNSSPPLIRIQNCHQKQDLGCKNPNFVKRVQFWHFWDGNFESLKRAFFGVYLMLAALFLR